MGTQSNMLLLGVPAEVFWAVTLAQRWCVHMYMSFKAHPYAGLNLKEPEQKRMWPKVPFAPMVSVLMWRQFVSCWSSIPVCHYGQVTLLLHEVMTHLATVGSARCPQLTMPDPTSW